LGAHRGDQKRYVDAEDLFRRALEIRRRRLSSDHPDLATTLNDYAKLLRATNRPSEAENMEKRAETIKAKWARASRKE
jgi:hypothetical protein